jgi:hypothetical protein
MQDMKQFITALPPISNTHTWDRASARPLGGGDIEVTMRCIRCGEIRTTIDRAPGLINDLLTPWRWLVGWAITALLYYVIVKRFGCKGVRLKP